MKADVDRFLDEGVYALLHRIGTGPRASGSATPLINILRAITPTKAVQPFQLCHFLITNRCNFQCPICIAQCRMEKEIEDGIVDVALDKLESVLDQMAGCTAEIFITGGEPTLYRGEDRSIRTAGMTESFFQLLEFAAERFEHVYVATNGWNVPEEDEEESIKFIGELPDNVTLKVSLNDANEQEMQRIRREDLVKKVRLLERLVAEERIPRAKVAYCITLSKRDETQKVIGKYGLQARWHEFNEARARGKVSGGGLFIQRTAAQGGAFRSRDPDLDAYNISLKDQLDQHDPNPWIIFFAPRGDIPTSNHIVPLVGFPEEGTLGNYFEDPLVSIVWNLISQTTASRVYRLVLLGEYLRQIGELKESDAMWQMADELHQVDPGDCGSEFRQMKSLRAAGDYQGIYQIISARANPMEEEEARFQRSISYLEHSYPVYWVIDQDDPPSQQRLLEHILDSHPELTESSIDHIARQLATLLANWFDDARSSCFLQVRYTNKVPTFLFGRDEAGEYKPLALNLERTERARLPEFNPTDTMDDVLSELEYYIGKGVVDKITGRLAAYTTIDQLGLPLICPLVSNTRFSSDNPGEVIRFGRQTQVYTKPWWGFVLKRQEPLGRYTKRLPARDSYRIAHSELEDLIPRMERFHQGEIVTVVDGAPQAVDIVQDKVEEVHTALRGMLIRGDFERARETLREIHQIERVITSRAIHHWETNLHNFGFGSDGRVLLYDCGFLAKDVPDDEIQEWLNLRGRVLRHVVTDYLPNAYFIGKTNLRDEDIERSLAFFGEELFNDFAEVSHGWCYLFLTEEEIAYLERRGVAPEQYVTEARRFGRRLAEYYLELTELDLSLSDAELARQDLETERGLYDLHVHSTYSDGLLTIPEIMKRAKTSGVRSLVVTDHNTLDHVEEALREAQERGIVTTTGIELTALVGDPYGQFRVMHVGGYGFDLEKARRGPDLNRRLSEIRRIRNEVAKGKCRVSQEDPIELRDRNGRHVEISVTFEEMEELAGGSTIIAKHFALLLSRKINDRLGLSKEEGVSAEDARQIFLSGRPELIKLHEAFIRKHVPVPFEDFVRSARRHWRIVFPEPIPYYTPEEAVREIIELEGMPVIFHPGANGVTREDIESLAGVAGGARMGLEVYCPQHTPEQIKHYRQIAWGLDLAVTAGSDFHGDDEREIGWLSHKRRVPLLKPDPAIGLSEHG